MNDRWIAGSDGSVNNQLSKSAADGVTRRMDFGDIPELIGGATIVACTVSATAGITVTSPAAIDNPQYLVSTTITGGTSGQSYAVTFTCTLSTGSTLSRVATMTVL